MGGLRLILIGGAFVGMVALSVVAFHYGGVGGLIGGVLGFVLRLFGRGTDWGERIGNAFIGALMGLPIGLLIGGVAYLVGPQLMAAFSAP
ncbi:MAG: hypothetical protein JNK94_00090 [Hyphomonadaceae bacterium]|nr:hypothetical protein [Hyphomonadaceae bacterium]